MQHFRRMVQHLAARPDIIAKALSGTGMTVEALFDAEFKLRADLLWQISANVRAELGEGWYFDFPVLWSPDVHSHLEGAMRLAPTLGQALDTLERVGSVRWPIARWEIATQGSEIVVSCHRLTAVPRAEWQMMGVIFALNIRTIIEVAHPRALADLAYAFEGPAPIDPAAAERVMGGKVTWKAERHAIRFPTEHMWSRSVLAEPRAFAALVSALETTYAVEPASWTTRVRNLLDDWSAARLGGEEIAAGLGVSRRTLERRLADEGVRFSSLLDEALQRRFDALAGNGELNLAQIAERLGYSDESALSRATRRWFGCTAAEARKRLRERKAAARTP
ncbi:AraC family transcriptional regulator [Novosphingobium sp. TH158]|uniref:helix-turn-helix transcriptional regulator n=1 Tax=Novosphingobium sp. TH158 TaxID=2067455 RepID=UPI00130412B6|nr:AraC family transcriptional regulator [Novosphingobium sp. TH158]